MYFPISYPFIIEFFYFIMYWFYTIGLVKIRYMMKLMRNNFKTNNQVGFIKPSNTYSITVE